MVNRLLTNQSGNNQMSSRSMFVQRKLYEQNIIKEPIFVKNKPIDILYENMFFGRVDQDKNIIQPKREFLKTIAQNNEGIVLALNFVVDAFFEFKKEWLGLLNKNKLDRNSKLLTINVMNGFKDINILYYNLMEIYFKQLVEYIQKHNKDKEIITFKDFLNVFAEFLDKQTPFAPVFLSTFNISRFNTPLSSGMVIDVSSDDCGDDKNKIEKYIEDNNFEAFKERGQKYGFIVDKNIPWRLYFDLYSLASEKFLGKYQLNENNVFQKVFEEVNKSDLDILKTYIEQFYRLYFSSKPRTTNCFGVKVKRQKFDDESKKEFDKTDIFLRFFIYVLGREKNINWTQEQFEEMARNYINIHRKLDKTRAMRYIQDRVSGLIFLSSEKQRTFKF